MKKDYTLHYPAWQIVVVEIYRMQIDPHKTIYVNVIARKINRVLDPVFKYINSLENKGLITTSKKGRCRYVTLTEKGIEIAKALTLIITQEVINKYKEGEHFE